MYARQTDSASLCAVIYNKNVWILGLLGFSAGLPLLLIFSSLSIWLREAGISKSSVTVFSWAALAYSFKFIWAPIVDGLPLPIIYRLGQRRSWLLFSQCMIIIAILWMASTNPTAPNQLVFMAFAAVLLGFSSATQDIVIDAYRIESAPKRMQGLLSASYTAGYRLGMIVAGAGTLYLAALFAGSADEYVYSAWRNAYACIAACMLVGVVTAIFMPEPIPLADEKQDLQADIGQYLRIFLAFVAMVLVFIVSYRVGALIHHILDVDGILLSALLTLSQLLMAALAAYLCARLLILFGFMPREFFVNGYIEPIVDFFHSHGRKLAILILLLIGLFRASDIVLGVIANIFYLDMGFDKTQIATAVKVFGPLMTIVGGFIGGICVLRFGVIALLFWSAILVMLTNICFITLVYFPAKMPLLYTVIAMDNLAGGLATTAFIAFLSSLVNLRFTAMQYSIFSSLMTLLPKLLGGYSGAIVESIGYSFFFIFTGSLCIPVLLLIAYAAKHLHIQDA